VIESDLPDGVIGQRPLSSGALSNLAVAVDSLPEVFAYAGLKDTETDLVRLSAEGDYTFLVEEKGGQNVSTWELRWRAGTPLSEVAGYLKALWETEEFKSEHEVASLQYVDFRFGKKVFYRLSGAAEPESTVDITTEP
jgi:hypothetical protein